MAIIARFVTTRSLAGRRGCHTSRGGCRESPRAARVRFASFRSSSYRAPPLHRTGSGFHENRTPEGGISPRDSRCSDRWVDPGRSRERLWNTRGLTVSCEICLDTSYDPKLTYKKLAKFCVANGSLSMRYALTEVATRAGVAYAKSQTLIMPGSMRCTHMAECLQRAMKRGHFA